MLCDKLYWKMKAMHVHQWEAATPKVSKFGLAVRCQIGKQMNLSSIWHWLYSFKPYKSLVTTILLCGCQTWTLLADSEKNIRAFETKCLRKQTNNWVQSKINFLGGSTGTSSGNCQEMET